MLINIVEAVEPISQQLEDQLTTPGLNPCTSGIVRMECLVGALKRQDEALAAAYMKFIESMELLSTTESAWDNAARIRAQHGLRLPDALHLSIAESNGCDEFWTTDAHFERMLGKINTRIHFVG